jgi:cell division protein FtsW
VGIADLGTAIVLLATTATVFYVAGLQRRYIALAFTMMLLFAGVAVASKGYRLGRVLSYVDPEYKILDMVDPHGFVKDYIRRSSSVRDPGYQARQSKIALGSGGIFGVGLMQSKQKLFYLPEAHTDFIYAVVGEELGFWGTTGVLFGFLVILWRGLRLYVWAPDEFAKYLALGVTVSVVFQAFINMSVVLEMGPTKGIPLPMISYGGSSLLSTLISLGILLSVSENTG